MDTHNQQSLLRSPDISELPDLPELESVEVRTEGTVVGQFLLKFFFILLAGIITATILLIFICGIMFISEDPVMCAVALLFGAVFSLADRWIIKRFCIGEYYWKTTSDGLLIQKLLHKILIRWTDVTDASLDFDAKGKIEFVLYTQKRRYKLAEMTTDNRVLQASIWQHLRRHGKADNVPLLDVFHQLWKKVPDAVPQDMEWANPKPIYLIDEIIRFSAWLAVFGGMAGYFVVKQSDPAPGIVTIAAIATFVMSIIYYMKLITIKHFEIKENGFRAETYLRKVELPWRKIKSVRFTGGHGSMPAMQLNFGFFKDLVVPWYPQHPNSARLILAIIRCLRAEGHLGPIPVPMGLTDDDDTF